MSRPLRLLIVAGEVSGDLHAARLLEQLRAREPGVTAFGIGGDRLRAVGMETLYETRDMAVMGFSEVIRRLGFFRRALREMESAALVRRPDAVILVDYPGFNLRLAARLRSRGLKVIYYICPQVWAWHRSRVDLMARVVDRLIAIFPFEPPVFEDTGLRVSYVGHPLVDEARVALDAPPMEWPWPGGPRIALLPGSRRQEIERILPPLWAAAKRVEQHHPEASFLLASPTEPVADMARRVLARQSSGPARFDIVVGRTHAVLRQARAAWVASGTATVDAALMNCPHVVVYRTSLPTYLLGRMLIRVPHIGMVNLVAGRRVCPELIQGQANPVRLADALNRLIEESPARAETLEGLAAVRRALGTGGAAARAADIVLEELGRPVQGNG